MTFIFHGCAKVGRLGTTENNGDTICYVPDSYSLHIRGRSEPPA